jgi:DNA-binding transcriptional regulator YhcF (GntR family)
MDESSTSSSSRNAPENALSYKFQRLREKLRQAIASGELNGKLPGERALAKRFHVNAKTLSKALTDLAAEGVLDRSIGRGTFVKGQAPPVLASRRWLVVCDGPQITCELIQMMRSAHPDLDVVADVSAIRPSFLNQFSAVVDLATETPDAFLRDLVVRNIPVVIVGKEPKTYSTHAVLFDAPLAASQLGRDLLLGGHLHLAGVESDRQTVVIDTLRKIAARYAPEAIIDGCLASDVSVMLEAGVTAFVCESVRAAHEVKQQLDRLGIAVPASVSVTALGMIGDEQPFSGYFVHRTEELGAITQLLGETQSYRPTTLWLAGRSIDRGTVAPVAPIPADAHLRYGSAIA